MVNPQEATERSHGEMAWSSAGASSVTCMCFDQRAVRSASDYDDYPTILRGIPEVLSAVSETDELRRRVGQQSDLSTDLLLILSRHNSHHRRPVLVLLRTDGLLSAAVIFVERCVLGLGIGLLRAGDQAGDGAVIAFGSERKTALLAAIGAVLKHGRSHTVAATLNGVTCASCDQPEEAGIFSTSASRLVRRKLPLGTTLAETLHQRFLPKRRKNLLYYYRTLTKKFEVEFVPEIPKAEIQEAIMELSCHSWPRRSLSEVACHCEFLRRHPESFCMGMRVNSGPWLSIITGWRVDGVTHMPWQLNHDEYKRESIMQVMRTFLMEYESLSGQTALSWVGGTVSFQSACEPEICLDVLRARRGLRSAFIRHVLAPIMFKIDPNAFTGGSLMLLLPSQSRPSSQALLGPDS